MLHVTGAQERIAIGNTDNFDTVLAMRCEVIALDGVFDTGLSAARNSAVCGVRRRRTLPLARYDLSLSRLGARTWIDTAPNARKRR